MTPEQERQALDILAKVARAFDKCATRYIRCGSDWHERMPGNWPFDLTLTMDDVRGARDLILGVVKDEMKR